MTEGTDEVPIADKVIKLIRGGRLDHDLKTVIDAAIVRSRLLRAREAYEMVQKIQIGDRIKIKAGIRPKYLEGERGFVIEVSGHTRAGVPMVDVKLDRPIGKFRGGRILLHGSSFEVLPRPTEQLVGREIKLAMP